MPSHERAPRTIWEEGQHPGRLVVRASAIALLTVALIHLLIDARLGLVFDAIFIVVCVGAALWVRPRDFFTVGVMPPLLLAGVVLPFAIVDRDTVARGDDVFIQAFVSGLAHHALPLAAAYALTLGVLALRQVALRHHGALRRAHHPAPARPSAPRTRTVPHGPTAPEVVGPSDVSPVIPQQRSDSAEETAAALSTTPARTGSEDG